MASKFKYHQLAFERTFLMVKPDGVMRGLIGEIIKRMEQRGLKIVAMKMVQVTKERADGFYPKKREWIERLGQNTLKTFKEYEVDPVEMLGTDDPIKIGQDVRDGLLEYVTLGPVVQMAIEGVQAISVVRKLVGKTLPVFSEPGTIRGDFTHDASTASNMEKRSIFNLVHASETKEEAAHEVSYWFNDSEIHDYDRSDHLIMFGDKRNL